MQAAPVLIAPAFPAPIITGTNASTYAVANAPITWSKTVFGGSSFSTLSTTSITLSVPVPPDTGGVNLLGYTLTLSFSAPANPLLGVPGIGQPPTIVPGSDMTGSFVPVLLPPVNASQANASVPLVVAPGSARWYLQASYYVGASGLLNAGSTAILATVNRLLIGTTVCATAAANNSVGPSAPSGPQPDPSLPITAWQWAYAPQVGYLNAVPEQKVFYYNVIYCSCHGLL
jgi:hypothetical protein